MTAKYDEFTRDFQKAEGKLNDMHARVKRLKGEKDQAEKRIEKQKREMRHMSARLEDQRVKEQQEVKILSDMLSLTISPSSQKSTVAAAAGGSYRKQCVSPKQVVNAKAGYIHN